MCWLLRAPDKNSTPTLECLGRWPRPACSFRDAQAATLLEFLVPLTNCFVRRWFCLALGLKLLLHRHNWLSFGKFKDTERFLISCPRHVSSLLPSSGKTCKYAMAPITETNVKRFSAYRYIAFCCVCLVCCAADFRISGGNYELLCISNAVSLSVSLGKLITFQLIYSSYTIQLTGTLLCVLHTTREVRYIMPVHSHVSSRNRTTDFDEIL
jgi:hypothetical protein